MKIRVALISLFGLALAPMLFAASLSSPTNEVYLAVGRWQGAGTNEPVPFDAKLAFLAFCDTGKVELAYPADPAYSTRVKMFDSKGEEVPKARLGKKFGSMWDKLHYRATKMGVMLAWGAYKDNPELGGGKPLPAPADLFMMEKSGIYTLEIQMQMYKYSASTDPATWQANLICFSQVRIKVEKPR